MISFESFVILYIQFPQIMPITWDDRIVKGSLSLKSDKIIFFIKTNSEIKVLMFVEIYI